MTQSTANDAIKALLKTLSEDVAALADEVGIAVQDMADGSRNGAIGALAASDNTIERISATLVAARAIHRAARD